MKPISRSFLAKKNTSLGAGQLVKNQETFAYRLFLIPLILVLVSVTLYPLLYNVYISLTDLQLTKPYRGIPFVGLENYAKLFSSSHFYATLTNTLLMVVGSVALQFLLGLALALLLNRSLRGFGVVRTLLLLPMVVTPTVAALTWSLMYNPSHGVLRYFLSVLGLQSPQWLSDPSLALFSIILVDVWEWTPFTMLLILSELHSVPADVYEAAQIDGASGLQILTKITIPLIKPLIGVVLLIRTMDTFKVFEKIYVLTGGGPGAATETLMFSAYRQAFGLFKMGYAASISLILLVIVLSLNALMLKATQTK